MHVGQAGQYLWPSIQDALLTDLEHIHSSAGPFDAVFFTGDLVQRGHADEYQEFDRAFEPIRALLQQLGSTPCFLAIPGNHDLKRPDEFSNAVQAAERWEDNPGLREDFWSSATNELRIVVKAAFQNWHSWYATQPVDGLEQYESGLFPGDYRGTLVANDLRIGIIAVNTALLQLRKGDLKERLPIDLRQVSAVFPDGLPAWARTHDLTILLTHHPSSWLDKRGNETLDADLLAAGKVGIHLQGHEHNEDFWYGSRRGSLPRLTVLGRSLFGLAEWGESGDEHTRMHGYFAGEVTFKEAQRSVRVWPRVATAVPGGGWQIGADHRSALQEDEATEPVDLGPPPARTNQTRRHLSPLERKLAGWKRVTRANFQEFASKCSADDLERFYDGARPSWSHTLDRDDIPPRAAVGEAVTSIKSRSSAGICTFTLFVGPSGEGKSTALLQSASRFVQDTDWKVLWRPNADVPLDPSAVLDLPHGGSSYLLVGDDADGLAADLWHVRQVLEGAGRSDVHFLLAARDTDWKAAGGDGRAWGSALRRISMRELTRPDARAIVRAWQRHGDGALRELSSIKDEGNRIKALMDASRPKGIGRGSFFGAVLHTRFSAEDLRAHVQDVMNRLAQRTPNGEVLRRAFILVAACDAIEVEGIDRNVLADVLGEPRPQILSEVVQQLGEEAAAVNAGAMIRTRHVDIARAALALAEQSGENQELGETYAAIVRQTMITGRSMRFGDSGWHGKVVNMGPRIVQMLPADDFPLERRLAIGVCAAEAAINTDNPQPLAGRISLAHTLREGEQADRGASLLASAVHETDLPDYVKAIRGATYEWSVCAGQGKPLVNFALAAFSLSDELNPAPLTTKQARLGLAGLGVTLLNDVEAGRDGRVAGLLACGWLGMHTKPDSKALSYFRRYLSAGRQRRGTQPSDMGAAIATLEATTKMILGELGVSGEAVPFDCTALHFHTLQHLLANHQPRS